MRIGIDGRYIQDHFPGIGRYTYCLCQGLAGLGGDHTLVIFCNHSLRNTRYDLSAFHAFENVELVEVNAPTVYLQEHVFIPRELSRQRVDLFHSPYYIRPYVVPCPTVVTIHDLIPLRYPLSSRWTSLAFGLTTRLALLTARRVVAVSRATRDDLVSFYHVPSHKIAVIPEAADPHYRLLPPEAVADVRRRYSLPERFALHVGVNKPHKNLVRLVEAVGRIARQEDVYLVLAGRRDPRYGEERQAVSRMGMEKRVIFRDDVPEADLPALYNAAEMFVFPSLWEGFGLPVVEAMACGRPVICSSVSAMPEAAGEAAWLVDPLDVQDLALAIGTVWSNESLRQEMREKSLKQAARFSWERTAEETLHVYFEAVGR